MFRNNFKTAIRSLLKNKGFTFLNISGLAIGLATFFIILLFVVDELSFDRFNLKADRIFRVNTDVKYGGTSSSQAIAAPAVAGALIKDFPEVEKAVRLLPDAERFKKGNEFVLEDKVAYSDPSLFDIFTIPMIAGNPVSALADPNSIVISEKAAKKYFNTTDVLGQYLTIIGDGNSTTSKKITGVIRDMPKQSHFYFDFFLSMASLPISNNEHFNAIFPFNTYLLLKPGADYKKLEAKFPSFMRANIDFLVEMEKGGDYLRINLTPLNEIHLRSNRQHELGSNGSMQYIRIFSAIALFILIIACINFMNLSTARSSNRAREVGVRKVLGSSRKSLIIQFMTESFLISFVATIIAIALAWIFLPMFNHLSDKELVITNNLSWLLPSLVCILIIVSVFAGSYPSFFLSAFQPVQVLKGKLAAGFKGSRLRSILVVFQFSLSIFLIIGTMVIYNQLQYIKNKSLGFDRNQVLIIKNLNSLGANQSKILKQEIQQSPEVLNITMSSFLPTGERRWQNYVSTKTSNLQTQFWPVDENYLNTLGMSVVKGRNFSQQFSTDSSAMIINETAAKMFGIANDPLNEEIYYGDKRTFHVIGVIKDFNFNSLRENISPVVMIPLEPWGEKEEGDNADNLCIKVNTNHVQAVLSMAENKWKILSPHQHFEYSFMDDDFDANYRVEQRMGKIFIIFTSLAIIIACLGLFGLAAYAAEQRSREISIRKILGAEVSAIVAMLSKDFIKLVLISIVIAAPLAWFIMQKWLQDFAYRTSVHWWILAIAGSTAVLIAFLTVSFQSIKAANTDPVKNLRSE